MGDCALGHGRPRPAAGLRSWGFPIGRAPRQARSDAIHAAPPRPYVSASRSADCARRLVWTAVPRRARVAPRTDSGVHCPRDADAATTRPRDADAAPTRVRESDVPTSYRPRACGVSRNVRAACPFARVACEIVRSACRSVRLACVRIPRERMAVSLSGAGVIRSRPHSPPLHGRGAPSFARAPARSASCAADPVPTFSAARALRRHAALPPRRPTIRASCRDRVRRA